MPYQTINDMNVIKVVKILKALKADGWVLDHQKGSHRKMTIIKTAYGNSNY